MTKREISRLLFEAGYPEYESTPSPLSPLARGSEKEIISKGGWYLKKKGRGWAVVVYEVAERKGAREVLLFIDGGKKAVREITSHLSLKDGRLRGAIEVVDVNVKREKGKVEVRVIYRKERKKKEKTFKL